MIDLLSLNRKVRIAAFAEACSEIEGMVRAVPAWVSRDYTRARLRVYFRAAAGVGPQGDIRYRKVQGVNLIRSARLLKGLAANHGGRAVTRAPEASQVQGQRSRLYRRRDYLTLYLELD